MKMQVLTVPQSQYGVAFGGSNKLKDWASTLISPAQTARSSSQQQLKNTIGENKQLQASFTTAPAAVAPILVAEAATILNQQENVEWPPQEQNNLLTHNLIYYCDDNNSALFEQQQQDTQNQACVDELSKRLLDELRAAKTQHLTCTEVSLPCDLTPRIASEIIRISEHEPCGIRGCTIYIEFEDETNNSRRIATLNVDPETISTFEIYLRLRQDHRGWTALTALLPQFMKNLTRTITISPDFSITKHKLYSPSHENSCMSFIIRT